MVPHDSWGNTSVLYVRVTRFSRIFILQRAGGPNYYWHCFSRPSTITSSQHIYILLPLPSRTIYSQHHPSTIAIAPQHYCLPALLQLPPSTIASQHYCHCLPALLPLPPSTIAIASQHYCHCLPALLPLPPSTIAIASQHYCHCLPALLPLPPSTIAIASQHYCHCLPAPSSQHYCHCLPALLPLPPSTIAIASHHYWRSSHKCACCTYSRTSVYRPLWDQRVFSILKSSVY